MDKYELISKLREASELDTASGHILADDALIEYIGDPDIAELYKSTISGTHE